MTFSLSGLGVRGIVLDIEGTVTPIAFVHEVLFPYARTHLRQYLAEHKESAAVSKAVRQLREEQVAEGASGDVAVYVEWLMDQDRKSTGLKMLQGLIWERGYRDRRLKSVVFPDVPPALVRWHRAGIQLAIFSSGSVLAQKLLLQYTPVGDLTAYLDHHFDTSSGPKQSSRSYLFIGTAMNLPREQLLFISDVVTELEAAHAAGLQVLLSVRPGNVSQPNHEFSSIHSFDEILD